MFRSALRYFHRIGELGLKGTLRRVWMRTINMLVVWVQSHWWGWKAHKKMSDAALLARTTSHWNSVEALLNHLAERQAASFLLPQESSYETAQFLKQNYPDYFPAVITEADAICRNELSLLDNVFKYPDGIDWHCDPVTGWRFPLKHRSRVRQYLGANRPVDLILFWELNRHQHFVTLGIAYWLTGDQRYVDAFCSQIQSWIETNPLQHGVNWYYGLEISVRLLAWTVAFQLFRGSLEFRKKIGKLFLESLWQQADFLSSHLQTTWSDVPNNHMMAELVGLVIIGATFPEFRAAAKWREKGLRLLNEQATSQMHPDGVNKEQATGYHRFVAELLLLIVARSRQKALPHEPILESSLEGMLEYIFFTLAPDGTAPMWGDSDYGRTLRFGKNADFWDFRPILSTGAALFGRSDWKYAAGRFDVESFWLLGSDGLDLSEQLDICPPAQTSRDFPYAGLYVIRDSWKADTDVAFFRCGPFGLGGEGHCAHAHCDLLSPILWISGQPLLVDSGTFTYHGPWRDAFRLTAAHNTIVVDDLEQAVPLPNFNWRQVPAANCLDWDGRRVVGKLKYSNQVEFSRELVHPRPGIWELVDRLTGNDKYNKLSWYFHFEESLSLRWDNVSKSLIVEKHDKPYVVVIPPGDVCLEIKSGWISKSYGIKKSNPMMQAIWSGRIPNSSINFSWKFMSVEKSKEVT